MAINVTTSPDSVKVLIDGTFSPWEVVTATNIQAEYGKAYILDGASPQTITLPAATPGSEGKGFAIKGQSSQLFTIAQNLSQSIDGIGWSTTSGPTGGLQSLNRNCTIILISLFDSGLIFGTYGISGYFDVIGQNLTIYNDGIINSEDGELLIGSTANGYPVRGNITSPDGSVTINNISGGVQLTNAGGGGGSSFESVATTNYVVDHQDTSYSVTGVPWLPGMCYSSSGELFLSRDVANGISTYNIFTNEINLNVIPLTAVGNFLPYYNDIVFISGSSRTDVFDMKTKTVTENVATGRPAGYFGRGVFDPITNKFYFAPLGATDILSFDPVALTYTPVALGSFPVGENDYVNIIRSSKTGKFYLIPRNSTTGAIGIFDPVAETVDLTTLNIGAGSNLFSNPGCEGYDEKIYTFGRSAAYIAVIDPVPETIDTTTYPLTNFFGNATLFPDNTIRSHSQLNPGQFAIVDLDNGGAFSTISGNNQFPSPMIVTYTGKVFGVSGTNNGRFMYTYSRKRTIPIERCISFMVNYN